MYYGNNTIMLTEFPSSFLCQKTHVRMQRKPAFVVKVYYKMETFTNTNFKRVILLLPLYIGRERNCKTRKKFNFYEKWQNSNCCNSIG